MDIRGSSSLSALKLPASCKTVACLDLAASSCNSHLDKNAAVKASGTTKKLYTMCVKTIESILDIQKVNTVRNLAIQFGCTTAVDLAQQILKRYEESQGVRGEDFDFNNCLFQGAALSAACKKQKIKLEKGKLKELCGVKSTCFDSLLTEMEKLADSIKDEKKMVQNKRTSTLLDEIERQAQEIPEKQARLRDDDEDGLEVKVDYEEWKRKILENAARAQAAS